ncbi:MAG: fibro-slime domain-containing protein, partial [Clostridia bacterium]|nr:fibro-slime domain-containing protein [Clostridia bacterium]
MEGIVDKKLVTYKRNKFVHKWWYRVVIWLAAGAVFITTYFLMLPALTATGDPGTTQIVSGNIINDEIQVNNVFPVQAVLGNAARYGGDENGDHSGSTKSYFDTYDVILIHANIFCGLGEFFYGSNKGNVTVGQSFPSNFAGIPVDLSQWIGIRIECATQHDTASTLSYDYHYVSQISMEGSTRRTEEYKGRIKNLARTGNQGFILMIRKDYMDEGFNGGDMYWPGCNKSATYEQTEDDKVVVNQTPLKSLGLSTWTTIYDDPGYYCIDRKEAKDKGLDALAYITFTKYVDQSANANAAANINNTQDKEVVDNFTFKLFDYTQHINKNEHGWSLANDETEAEKLAKLRAIAPYFNFRGGTYSDGGTSPWVNYWIKFAGCVCVDRYRPTCKSILHRSDTWDADGFTRYHATVEYDMQSYTTEALRGYPMLSFTHDARGTTRTAPSGLTELNKSLKYLFNGQQAKSLEQLPEGNKDRLPSPSVTEYAAKNTILQYNEDTGEYWYDSAQNAVDYDKVNNLFRVRSYRERNELTAAFGLDTHDYYDFMPFNYTKGYVSQVFYNTVYSNSLNDVSVPFETITDYTSVMVAHGNQPNAKPKTDINSTAPTNANYWFGMTMEFSFIQGKDGNLVHVDSKGNETTTPMIFEFSGDDDVWVFIDDVLVLDLGGTHGTVTGSINFQTGEVKQYLDWVGSPNNENTTSGNDATSFPTTLKQCFTRAGSNALNRVEWDSDNQNRFADYTTHTLKFYYLERGQAVANCSIKFNLQSFSDKSLVVEKQLDKETSEDPHADEVLDYLQKTQEYKFRVLQEDQQTLLFNAGDTFTKFNTITGETTKGCTVGAKGIFTLKHGEQAIFEDMWEKTGSSDSNIEQYYVQELRPDGQIGQYSANVQ